MQRNGIFSPSAQPTVTTLAPIAAADSLGKNSRFLDDSTIAKIEAANIAVGEVYTASIGDEIVPQAIKLADGELYAFGPLLGVGAFGEVYLLQNVVSGDYLVLKKQYLSEAAVPVDEEGEASKKIIAKEVAEHERQILLAFGNKSAQPLTYAEDQGIHYIAMDLVSGVSIENLLDNEIGIDDDNQAHTVKRCATPFRLMVAKNACLTLKNFLDKGYVHRDIKTENLMVDAEAKVRLIDFASAQAMSNNQSYSSDDLPSTSIYVAPELRKAAINGDGFTYNEKTEVYALGIALGRLFHLHKITEPELDISEDINASHLRENIEEIFIDHNAADNNISALTDNDTLTKINRIIQAMTHIDPSQRLSIKAAIESFANLLNEHTESKRINIIDVANLLNQDNELNHGSVIDAISDDTVPAIIIDSSGRGQASLYLQLAQDLKENNIIFIQDEVFINTDKNKLKTYLGRSFHEYTLLEQSLSPHLNTPREIRKNSF